MKIAIPILVATLLAGCASGPEPELRWTARQRADLARALAGKVAGPPVRCVSALGAGAGLRAIHDTMLMYEVNRRLVYQNRLIGRCAGLSRGEALLLDRHGSQYCRGDIVRTVDLPSGMPGGACALGDFVPYRAPAGD